jgi:hypothetical protein
VHGTPRLGGNDAELTSLAENRRWWAFRVLKDDLRLAARQELKSQGEYLKNLDSDAALRIICEWLAERGGGDIVVEYQRMLSP